MTTEKPTNKYGTDDGPVWAQTITDMDRTHELMNKLVGIGDPGAVFSPPLTVGERTLVTASESYVALGLGFGSGSELNLDEQPSGTSATDESPRLTSQGGGGGGGGLSLRRPIAAIVVGPHGVEVQPIIDLTKIGLAFITVLGSMAFLLSRMRRPLRN